MTKSPKKTKGQKNKDTTSENNEIISIIIHGRGGQGAVTTGQLLAIAAFYDGKYTQSFPNFGVERAGAPATAYCRISKEPINIRSQVYNADVGLVLDSSLFSAVKIVDKIKENGILIVNTNKKAEELCLGPEAAKKNIKVITVDATSIAMKIFNKPIINTAILGAFSAKTKMVSIESLSKAIEEQLSSKGQTLVKQNIDAVKQVYEKVQ